ncbi:MAG: XRE family transcriptional regulator [Negativicutes bacterium]|nr:XRE family transcriptional regulator [Negativicutes bacterium]
MGSKFKELWQDKNFITEEQKAKIDLEVELIGKLVEAREKKGMTQTQLAEAAGLKQAAVARMEKMKVTPKIDTVIKLLRPLGYKLAIVPDSE